MPKICKSSIHCLSLIIILALLKPVPLSGQLIRSIVKREANTQDVGNFLEVSPTQETENSNFDYEEIEIESDKLDGLTNPEDYYIWWLPGLNKLGLELDILKAKVAQIHLKRLYQIKKSKDCNNITIGEQQETLDIIDRYLRQTESILKNMTMLSASIKLIKDSEELDSFEDGIPTVLSQSIDTLGIRSKANVAISAVANFVKAEKGNRSCERNTETRNGTGLHVDEVISEYWLRIIPIASSVYWDEYTERDKKNLAKLIEDTF